METNQMCRACRLGRGAAARRIATWSVALLASVLATTSARGAVLLDQTLNGVSPMTGKDLSAHVVFSTKNSDLTVVVTNLGHAAEAPADVLTGVLFNISTNPTLTPGSIDFTSKNGQHGDKLLNPRGGDVLGDNWEFLKFATPVRGDSYGLGASGLGGTFGHSNFVSQTNSLDGVDFGLVNGLGPSPNSGVLVPLVSRSLTFTLHGISGSPAITGVQIQYGSALSEPALGVVPEPAALPLLLIGLGSIKRRGGGR